MGLAGSGPTLRSIVIACAVQLGAVGVVLAIIVLSWWLL